MHRAALDISIGGDFASQLRGREIGPGRRQTRVEVGCFVKYMVTIWN
jgi:hypothetical protein